MLRDIIGPIYAEYADNAKQLSTQEAINATREERIHSVWRMMVHETRRFLSKSKYRNRANFDAEDILSELWIALAERDHWWSPERGAYTTFASTIIHHALIVIADRSPTVQCPRNSTSRIKNAQDRCKNGTLSPKRAVTLQALLRVNSHISSLFDGYDHNRPGRNSDVSPHFTCTPKRPSDIVDPRIPDPSETITNQELGEQLLSSLSEKQLTLSTKKLKQKIAQL